MKVIVLGGTSGIGREVARRLAERGEDLFLLGRKPAELEKSAADLAARHPRSLPIAHAPCDLEQPDQFITALEAAKTAMGDFDTVIVTAGMFATQEQLDRDTELARRLSTVNFANTIAFCERARQWLLERGGGRLVVISSVAGDRGRKPVAIYGAAKAGLSHYLESLDHKFRSAGLLVLCVKPGFVKTPMTADLRPPPFAGEPEQVADDILRAMDRHKSVLYTPRIWALIMLVIRWFPRFVMRKINF